MTARPESSARPASPGDLGGLAAMRQTMTEFSLEGLSSLLDGELTLDAAATPKPVEKLPEAPVAKLADEARQSALTVTQSPLAAVRKSSLDRTHLYKSTPVEKATPSQPQPTMDLSAVRRSASEPTLSFGAPIAAPAPLIIPMASAVPAADVSRSGPMETSLWTAADRQSARFGLGDPSLPSATIPTIVTDLRAEDVEEPAPPSFDALPAYAPAPSVAESAPLPPALADFIQPKAYVAEPSSDVAPLPLGESTSSESYVSVDSPATHAATSHSEAPLPAALASFFPSTPRRSTTEVRWDEAVESDRQFTTMLLSELEDLPWRSDARDAVPMRPPAFAETAASDFLSADALGAVPASDAAVPSNFAYAEEPIRLNSDEPSSMPGVASAIERHASVSASPEGQLEGTNVRIPEPTREVRSLASFVLDRLTPGVSTVIAVVGCGETRSGADAAIALGAALADASGRSTLVVDADLQRRDLSRAVGAPDSAGFADALVRPANLLDFAKLSERDNLQVLPAGKTEIDPKEATSRLAAWIAQAKQNHGLIVTWVGVPDRELAERLCGAADATLLFAEVGKDRPARIEIAAKRLRQANARSLGAALVRG